MIRYAELACASNFSFLRGASHPAELVLTALLLGHAGMGLADRNSVAGVVRAHAALEELREAGQAPAIRLPSGGSPGGGGFEANPLNDGLAIGPAALAERARDFRLALGARLAFEDAEAEILAYPRALPGWHRLCRLLTDGKRAALKGGCRLTLADLLADTEGLSLILLPPRRLEGLEPLLARVSQAAPGRAWLGASLHRRGDDRRRLGRLGGMAEAADLRLVAVGDVLYADPRDRDLQDVLTCIREGVPIHAAGRRLEANAERHLKAPAEMARLFQDRPDAVAETRCVLDGIAFSLKDLRYAYPDEPVPEGWTPQAWLEALTRAEAAQRYPEGVPPKVEAALREELALIGRLDYARYFLTIHDIVAFARARGILCQGRGSAANSAVCFVLGITAVDPAEHDLLFARFVSEERREPPDIDVDFEHERREEVIQHIYAKYGRERAGIIATVISYRPRSAIRDVGRALGLTEDVTARLAASHWGSFGRDIREGHVRQAGLDPENPVIARAVGLARRLLGFPRHLSQHVGGFVIARGRLDEIVPVGNAAMPDRTFVEWDKDDVDALGLMKVDVLALGMLTCIRKALDLAAEHGGPRLGLADIPAGCARTYAMLSAGDSLGVFQVESRAQMNMLPRLRPRAFYDLVIQVAIVRPGPIQGDMVHPYLRRRAGIEPVEYPSPAPPHDPHELRRVLHRTCGVPLFQEQAMRIAMVAAEFTPSEANRLRRAMATFRHVGAIGELEALMVGRMIARGYEASFARRCFEQIRGFGSYGFPESHAASFAKLVYVSSWLKCHHPAAFACALLNSQPMGFYAPAQIVRDAEEHGVEVRPLDVNLSDWDHTLKAGGAGSRGLALRLGLRRVSGLSEGDARRLVKRRGEGYPSVEALARRAGLGGRALRLLADADALRSLGLDRREALWAVRRLPEDAGLPLFAAAQARELGEEQDASLPAMSLPEHVAADYATIHLSLKGHPMGMLREVFSAERVLSAAEATARPSGAWVRIAGVVLSRQRPGKGRAIFITIEDETGVVNLVLWARVFERFRAEAMGARLMLAEGRIERSPEGIVHLIAQRVADRTGELARLSDAHTAQAPPSPGDEAAHPQAPRGPAPAHPRSSRLLPTPMTTASEHLRKPDAARHDVEGERGRGPR